MKILVIRFSSIGDIILTTPVIRALKIQLDAEVHFCTKEAYRSLLESNPYVGKLFTLKESLNELTDKLKKENYDYVVDLHHNLRTGIIKRRLKTESFAFNKLNLEKWLMVNLKINKLPSLHIVDRYMECLIPLGVRADQQGLEYFIPEKDVVPSEWLPDTHKNGYVVYAIGGQHNTKKLPLKRMIELSDKINKPIILIGGKEDIEQGESIASFFRNDSSTEMEENLKKLNKNTVIFNACGKFNINQSASIIKSSTAVFTHDTGMMHIAAALKKQVFSIWGNTIPEFGMYPYKTKFTIFQKTGLSCRPCSKIGYSKCPKGHFKCMNEIEFDFYIP